MDRRPSWLVPAIVCGLAYLAAGIIFGELAGNAPSDVTRIAWRRAAWLVSALVFGSQIAYEHFRLRSSARAAGFHVGVAVGSFGLAVLANIHSQPTTRQRVLVVASLVLWPVLTAIPAFLVALVAAAGLARFQKHRTPAASA